MNRSIGHKCVKAKTQNTFPTLKLLSHSCISPIDSLWWRFHSLANPCRFDLTTAESEAVHYLPSTTSIPQGALRGIFWRLTKLTLVLGGNAFPRLHKLSSELRIGSSWWAGSIGCKFLLTLLLFCNRAPSPQCNRLLCTVSWDCLHQWNFFNKRLAAKPWLVQSSESSQTTGVLLDGQMIFPLSLRRKFVLVSCASLQAGEGCLFHIINGQRKRAQFILLIGMNVCSFKRKMCVFASPKQTHNFP